MHKTKIFTKRLASSILVAASLFGLGQNFIFSRVDAATSGVDAAFVSKNPPTIAWGSRIQNPKAVILCIHGLGLHKGAYDDFGKRMSIEGIPTFALDIRGFGDWHLNGNDKLDLSQSLNDIKLTLEAIKKQYPNAGVFLLGESMGGAIALRATAMYPTLISGLISSVPSGDRFSGLGEDMKVGFHALAGGFAGRFNAGQYVVQHATNLHPELRKKWGSDPAARTDFSPNELIAFQSFMSKNNESAANVKNTPVLILQGAEDKLVRPGGSFNIWDHLATTDRTFAASKTAEHLIFEYGQFNKDDINFVLNWMNKELAPPTDQSVSVTPIEPRVTPKVKSKDEILASAPNLVANTSPIAPAHLTSKVGGEAGMPTLSYWIELLRNGKRYCCNNKTSFHSGDEIRIHMLSTSDGYAYIVMKQGSSGAHAVLFPEAHTGRDNAITAAKDYALPSATWLKFDNTPGTEKVCLIFSGSPLDPDTNKYMKMQTAVVSADKSGSKDLCPTRMQISWDDPNPLIMPASTDNTNVMNASMVKISQTGTPATVLAVDIDLEHGT